MHGSIVRWLFSLGDGTHAFPLMDFVTTTLEELDEQVHQANLPVWRVCQDGSILASASPGGRCIQQQDISQILRSPTAELRTDGGKAISWMDVSWVDLVLHSGVELWQSKGHDVAAEGTKTKENSCDDMSTERDEAYIRQVLQGLDGLETLPLEQNEFKWADFFGRFLYGSNFCDVGLASLFLVASDVTAFAAAAVGGEHMERVQRALQLAQAVVQQYLISDSSHRGNVAGTHWPLWQLLRSIAEEARRGTEALQTMLHAAQHQAGWRSFPLPQEFVLSPTEQQIQAEQEVYLSVIVQCRNDDYGVGMLDRLNRMLETSTHMLHSAGLPAEIIIVEWNPPLGTPPIADVIRRAPGTADSVPIRVITVPTAVHMSIPHHKAHPIFEHIAENVAFRRAKGKFFLKTNIDNILSPDVILLIASRQLKEDAVYRATYMEYWVTGPEVDAITEPKDLIEWVFSREELLNEANHKLRELAAQYPEDSQVCISAGTVPTPGSASSPRPFYWAGSGDFVLASRALIFRVHGYPQIAQNWQTDDLIHCRLRAAGARQVVLQPPCVTVHQNHQRINRVRASTRWVVTDESFNRTCAAPFTVLPTETGLEDDWGYPDEDFVERVI